jgi:hypothetical protein
MLFVLAFSVLAYLIIRKLPLELMATIIAFIVVVTIAASLFVVSVGSANIVAGTTAVIGTAVVWYYIVN